MIEVEVIGLDDGVVDELTALDVERAVRARVRLGGDRRRPRRRRVRRRADDPALNRDHRGKDAPDRRALVPGRRRDGRPAAATAPRELGDVVICPPLHRGPAARPSCTARCTCPGMDHEVDDGEMLALQAELLRWVRAPTLTRARLRRARRAAERRQVDARQRDRRAQGRDRLRQAADDAPRDPRRRDDGRLAARARRPAGRAAPARRAHRAHAAARRARAGRRRRRAARGQRRAGDRARATASSPALLAGASAPGRDRGQQGRPPRLARGHGRGARRRPPSSASATRSSRSPRARAEGVQALVEHLGSLLPEGPFLFPADERSDQSEEVLLAELVREQVLRRTRQEVPHAVEVEVEEIEERRGDLIAVRARHVGRDRLAEGDPDRRRRQDDQGDRHRRPQGARARARLPASTSTSPCACAAPGAATTACSTGWGSSSDPISPL